MKTNNIELLNYLLSSITIIIFTACGGGSDSGESSNCVLDTRDSDNDGFRDVTDSDFPNDPFENGKYNNLENVVNSEGVKRILKIAKEKGLTVNLQLGNNPPKLNGYYKSETGGRVYYARNALGGRYTGASLAETEFRYCTSKGYVEDVVNSPSGPGFGREKLRGEGNYFTFYDLTSRKYSSECIGYHADIRSGKVDSKSGDIKNYKVVIAPLGYKEMVSGACDIYKTSRRWEEVFTTADEKKVTDLDELEYMCVDDNKAYIPKETWKNKEKQSCKCTADVEIECE